MGNLVNYAVSELKRSGYYDGDPMNKAMADHIVKLMEVFSDEGHSGFSASFASSLFNRLSKFEPISPLTGEDDEWMLVSDYLTGEIDYKLYQNKRCSHVFKEVREDSVYVYDSQGIVFVDKDGSGFLNIDSRVEIEFPYVPKQERKPYPED